MIDYCFIATTESMPLDVLAVLICVLYRIVDAEFENVLLFLVWFRIGFHKHWPKINEHQRFVSEKFTEFHFGVQKIDIVCATYTQRPSEWIAECCDHIAKLIVWDIILFVS